MTEPAFPKSNGCKVRKPLNLPRVSMRPPWEIGCYKHWSCTLELRQRRSSRPMHRPAHFLPHSSREAPNSCTLLIRPRRRQFGQYTAAVLCDGGIGLRSGGGPGRRLGPRYFWQIKAACHLSREARSKVPMLCRSFMMVCVLLFACTSTGYAVRVRFDYTYDTYLFPDGTRGFFNKYPQAKLTLEHAAKSFMYLRDHLTAIVPTWPGDPDDPNRPAGVIEAWRPSFFNPATGALQEVPGLVVPTDTLIVFVGGRDIPGSPLGRGGPSHGGYSYVVDPWYTNITARGQGSVSDVRGPDAREIAPWGGAIAFDTITPQGTLRNWHFDIMSPPLGDSDFLSVAIHELGHIFGFGTSDSFARLTSGTQFIGPRVAELNGGVPVDLDASGAHWKEDTKSPPSSLTGPEAAMTPSGTYGRHNMFTRLDYAALDDIGWDISLQADINLDGRSDRRDLAVLAGNYGWRAGATWAEGDQDDNGKINLVDILRMRGSMEPLAPPSVAVPEPGTRSLVLMTLAACYRRRLRICAVKQSAGLRHSPRKQPTTSAPPSPVRRP